MDKTKLDIDNPHHQILVGTLTMFIEDFGYNPIELYELIDDCKKQLWLGLREISNEKEAHNDDTYTG